MIRYIGVHGPDHAEIVRTCADVLKNVADFQSRFAVLLKFVRRTERRTRFPFGRQATGDFLAMPFIQGWLWIEGIHMGRTTIGENVDHMFRLRRLLRSLDLQRIGPLRSFLENAAQRQRSKSHAAAIQEIAPREEKMRVIDMMGGLHALNYASQQGFAKRVSPFLRNSAFRKKLENRDDFV